MKIHYLTLVTRSVAQYFLHHVTYAATKSEVAMSNGLGGYTFTRNVMDEYRDGQTDELTLVRNKYTFFSKEKAGLRRPD